MSYKQIVARIALIGIVMVSCTQSLIALESDVQEATQGGAVTTEQKPGISLFSRFPVILTLSLDGGYDSNVNTTSNSHGSAYGEGRANLLYDVKTERSSLTVTGGTDVIYFSDGATGPNPEVNTLIQLGGRYNYSEKLVLTMSLSGAYQAEPDFSANVGPNQRVGYFFTTTDGLSGSYQWTSLVSTVSTETFRLIRYDDSTVGALEDRIENTLGQQMLFHISMRTALVAEYRLELIDYDTFPRDSISHSLLGGIDHSFNEHLNVTLRGGATFRTYTNGNDSTKTAPDFDGALNYVIGRTSSLSWTASYGLEAPDAATTANTTTFRTGVQVKYGLTSRISCVAGAYYIHEDNESFNFPGTGSIDTSEDTYDVSLGLQYAFNRQWSFHVGFDASGITSDQRGNDYSRQRYSAGLSFTF
jgi:hypothetical protein